MKKGLLVFPICHLIVAGIQLHPNVIFFAKGAHNLLSGRDSFSSYQSPFILWIFHKIAIINDELDFLLLDHLRHSGKYTVQLFLTTREPNDDLFDPIRLLGFEFFLFQSSLRGFFFSF